MPPAAGDSRVTTEGSTVLVVEDDPMVRGVTVRILTQLGYEVLVAASGREALALAVEHEGPIDLLLTDVIMPSMGGLELAERVRRVRPKTKVLFCSGYTACDMAAQGLQVRGADLLEKPFTKDELGARVCAAIADARATPLPR